MHELQCVAHQAVGVAEHSLHPIGEIAEGGINLRIVDLSQVLTGNEHGISYQPGIVIGNSDYCMLACDAADNLRYQFKR